VVAQVARYRRPLDAPNRQPMIGLRLQKDRPGSDRVKASARRMYFVPEGQHDRSHSTRYRLLTAGLARSAWKSVQRENLPVGYGMIGRSYPRGVSRRKMCAVLSFSKSGHSNHRIVAHGCANQTVPSGTKAIAHRRDSHQVSAYRVKTPG
jgi:hypothetical protein